MVSPVFHPEPSFGLAGYPRLASLTIPQVTYTVDASGYLLLAPARQVAAGRVRLDVNVTGGTGTNHLLFRVDGVDTNDTVISGTGQWVIDVMVADGAFVQPVLKNTAGNGLTLGNPSSWSWNARAPQLGLPVPALGLPAGRLGGYQLLVPGTYAQGPGVSPQVLGTPLAAPRRVAAGIVTVGIIASSGSGSNRIYIRHGDVEDTAHETIITTTGVLFTASSIVRDGEWTQPMMRNTSANLVMTITGWWQWVPYRVR